jgi:hypothetical protein
VAGQFLAIADQHKPEVRMFFQRCASGPNDHLGAKIAAHRIKRNY